MFALNLCMPAVFVVVFSLFFLSLCGALQLHAALAIPLVPVRGPNYVQNQGIQGSPLCSRFGGSVRLRRGGLLRLRFGNVHAHVVVGMFLPDIVGIPCGGIWNSGITSEEVSDLGKLKAVDGGQGRDHHRGFLRQ